MTECDFYRCKFQELSECSIISHILINPSYAQSFPHYCPLCQQLKTRVTHRRQVWDLFLWGGVCFIPHFDLNLFFTAELFHKFKPAARGPLVLGLLENCHAKGTARK